MRRNRYGIALNRAGEMVLSRNQLVLLLALAQQPGKKVQTKRDWIEACEPVLEQFGWVQTRAGLMMAISNVSGGLAGCPEWLRVQHLPNGHECELTQLGDELVDRILAGEVTLILRKYGRSRGDPCRFHAPSSAVPTQPQPGTTASKHALLS